MPQLARIEAPVVAQHLNAHTRMSAITVDVEKLTITRASKAKA